MSCCHRGNGSKWSRCLFEVILASPKSHDYTVTPKAFHLLQTQFRTTCLSVVWDFWWKRRPPQFRKRFPHWPHTYGFSPVWIRKWRVSAPECRNRTPHTEQEYGRSPVCMRKCVLRFSMRLKSRPHSLQWYGLQPGGNSCCLTGLPAFPAFAVLAALTLCRWLWCLRRSLARLNEWPQILHWWILMGTSVLIWTSSSWGGWTRWVLATDW